MVLELHEGSSFLLLLEHKLLQLAMPTQSLADPSAILRECNYFETLRAANLRLTIFLLLEKLGERALA